MKNQEIELKLRLINEVDAALILEDDLFSSVKFMGTPMIHDFETTYYDTPDYRLMQAQCTYRIRKSGEYSIATVKDSGSSQGGLHVRNEWNVKLDRNLPDLVPFSNLPIGPKLSALAGEEELIPIFQTNFQRQVLEVVTEDGSLIELAVDQGNIISGEKKAPLAEVELELKNGQVVSLLELGALLAEKTPMILEEKSKYLRGLILSGLPVKEELTPAYTWDKKKDLQQTLREVMLFSLKEIINKQEIFLKAPEDPETAHQLRVEIRRLRALLSFLKPFFSQKEEKKLQDLLRKIAQKFGYLREIDVMLEGWEELGQSRPTLSLDNSALQKVLKEERKLTQLTVTQEISSGITTPILLEIWAELINLSFDEISVEDLKQRFQTLLLKMSKISKKTNYQVLAEVHALRIRGKKLRYAANTFGPVLRKKDKVLFSELKALQDALGQICDTHRNQELLRDLNEKYPSAALSFDSGVLSGWQQTELEEQVKKAKGFSLR
ncbi:CHAD domain-containing protein [Dehalobacterium formicoaceticum]|uniref:CYTH and CHAD domain-containing protein n=1 Tax=Dehalobacterium formicoaceticum TaxID=51515 RepID=UPI0031F6376F